MAFVEVLSYAAGAEGAEGAGVNVVDTVIANLEPDDEALETLKALGAKLAE